MGQTNFSGPVRSKNGFINDGSIVSGVSNGLEVIETGRLKVELTSAQILALNTTAITLMAAPGANKAIVITGITAHKPAGTAYAGVDVAEDIVFRYTDASGAIIAAIETTGFVDQATAQTRYTERSGWTTNAPTALFNSTPVANAVVVAHMTTGNITTGNSPIRFIIEYKVIPTVIS